MQDKIIDMQFSRLLTLNNNLKLINLLLDIFKIKC